MTERLQCEQAGCPIVTDGRCLEGFPEGAGCPYVTVASLATLTTNSADEGAIEPASEEDKRFDGDDVGQRYPSGDDVAEPPEIQWIHLGGDAALTLEEADEVAAMSPCRVVLVAGEFESGKTTLVVELYAQFLRGPFAGADFGGSFTLRALDSRHHPARERSGELRPTTDRTADDDMRVLHLRLRRHEQVSDLLFSDVAGEFFENVIDGASVAAEVPLARRADVCVVAIDGASVGDPAERHPAFTRARLLLGGLAEPGGLKPGTRTTIVLTKLDLLDEPSRRWAGEQLSALQTWAADGSLDVTFATVAARPPEAPPQGLDTLLDQILPPPHPRSRVEPPKRAGDRQFWNQPESP